MLSGRLGLDKARIPYADRHGLLGLDRGTLSVEAGCLRFVTAGGALPAGDYEIPHQAISMIMLGPGSSVTHDALRLMASHGLALAAVGQDGVRLYTAPPLGANVSALARRQTELWARPASRMAVARRMYALRFGEILPTRDIESLRGLEGVRAKRAYVEIAAEFGLTWKGRWYDRENPSATNLQNQAINHASSAVYAAAGVAVAATATIPQLGFIHEDSGHAFVLDIADLFRDSLTLRVAFAAAKEAENGNERIERLARRHANAAFAKADAIPSMIDRIKQLLKEDG